MIDKALLVGSFMDNEDDFLYSMEELKNLAKTCNLDVVDTLAQKIKDVNPKTYLGSGKVEEIRDFVNAHDIDVVVLNDNLSTSQMRNIQEIVNCRVIDRTMLILDIFASRAKTKEAIMQVEIAQLKYILSRLSLLSKNDSEHLGLRGPGETKYELDRRKIEKRISLLEDEIKSLVLDRQIQRKKRKKNEIPVVSIVGYTNSGKSTLLNTMLEYGIQTNEDKTVYTEDLLFATLETTTRQIVLESNKKFLLTDTVGFVSRLPHQLVKAFRSTLEEITESDLVLHVIDLSNPNYEKQKQITESVLKDLGVKDIPIINVYNKIDKVDNFIIEDGIFISAKNKQNIDKLILEISKKIFKNYKTVKMHIPYSKGNVFNFLKENANVLKTDYNDYGINIVVELSEQLYYKYKDLIQ